jgi:hypothetical protein
MMTIFFPTLRQYEIAQVIDTIHINNNEDNKNNKNNYTDYIELKLLSRRIFYKTIYSKFFSNNYISK